MPRLTRGILLICTTLRKNDKGDATRLTDNAQQIITAGLSLAAHMPMAKEPITLASDQQTWQVVSSHVSARTIGWSPHLKLHPDAAERVLTHSSVSSSHMLGLPYLWKLLALIASPYSETVYMDTDMVVLSSTFVSDLLLRSLRVSDLAFAQDPNRPQYVTIKEKGRLHQALANKKVMPYPPMYGHGIPPLCTALIVYRNTSSVRTLFTRAAGRMVANSDRGEYTQRGMLPLRQGDQEMIWSELAHGEPNSLLRLFVLPEEYYCPSWLPMIRSPQNKRHHPYFKFVEALAAQRVPMWSTTWGVYPCHSIHGKFLSETLRQVAGPGYQLLSNKTISNFESEFSRGFPGINSSVGLASYEAPLEKDANFGARSWAKG